MAKGHTKGGKKGLFCSLRAGKCPCGNKYTAPCDATAAAWEAASEGSTKFLQKYTEKDGTSTSRFSSQNAHHIACVASVTAKVTCNTEIDKVVRVTKWCVNDKSNMIALPLWPHTFEWYIKFQTDVYMFRRNPPPPPFVGLAQHDYDHGRYIKEVGDAVDRVVKSVKLAIKNHEDNPSGDLSGGLNGVIADFQAKLQGRDTQGAWMDGLMDRGQKWYTAFSMCTSDPTPKAFPVDNNALDQKVQETHRLMNLGR